MPEHAEREGQRLHLARLLVNHLERGDEPGALSVIAELADLRDSILFREVGRVTRELHESINGFVKDARLADIAQTDMPDAAERLRYVIATTEQAANATLGAVEESIPLADSLRSDAQHLAAQWAEFDAHAPGAEGLRALGAELTEFLSVAQANSAALHEKLSEVLLAQGYQDITGQVICKVIALVKDVEGKLVELVRLSGQRLGETPVAPASRDISAQGPVVPGVDRGDVVGTQDDVDDLLSSLGF